MAETMQELPATGVGVEEGGMVGVSVGGRVDVEVGGRVAVGVTSTGRQADSTSAIKLNKQNVRMLSSFSNRQINRCESAFIIK